MTHEEAIRKSAVSHQRQSASFHRDFCKNREEGREYLASMYAQGAAEESAPARLSRRQPSPDNPPGAGFAPTNHQPGETMKNDHNQLPSPAEFLASLLADALGSSRSDDGCDDYCEGCPGALPVPLLEVPADGDAWIAQPFDPIPARVRHIRPLNPEYVREWATKGLLFATREDAVRITEHLIGVAQRGLEVARKRKAADDEGLQESNAPARTYQIAGKPMPMPLSEWPADGFVWTVVLSTMKLQKIAVERARDMLDIGADDILKSGLVFHTEDDAQMVLDHLKELTAGMR